MAQIDLNKAQKIADLVGDEIQKHIGTPDEKNLDGKAMLDYAAAVALIDIARSLRIIAEDHK